MSNEITAVPTTSLSVNIDTKALSSLSNQRSQLRQFIKNELQKDSDYGIIPGVKKESLYKPGAEKLANIFQLGSRIVKTDKEIDLEKNFAMIAVTVEVFHLPTGKAISQCEGICNSQEKKYKTRKNYSVKPPVEEVTPIGDILNTLTKMAQKRAYVGAVIIATGASDFFTMDVEDMPREYFQAEEKPKTVKSVVMPGDFTKQNEKDPQVAAGLSEPDVPQFSSSSNGPAVGSGSYICNIGKKYVGQSLEQMGPANVQSYAKYLLKSSQEKGEKLTGDWQEFIFQAQDYLTANGMTLNT